MADPDSRSGMRYANEGVLSWTDALHVPHDDALSAAFESPERYGLPQIQVGPSEGKLMALLQRLLDARKVVEIGTLAGYSAIHLARALPTDGRLWTIEREPAHAEVARNNLRLAGLDGAATVLVGPALDLLPTVETTHLLTPSFWTRTRATTIAMVVGPPGTSVPAGCSSVTTPTSSEACSMTRRMRQR